MERTAFTDRLVTLIKMLYEVHCTGGPLHVELDDWNLDGRIMLCYDPNNPIYQGRRPLWTNEELDEPHDDLDGRTTRSVCDEIAVLMNDMTEPQRMTALAIADGYTS